MTDVTPKRIVLIVAEDDDDEFLLTKEAIEACGLNGDIHRVKDGEDLLNFLRMKGERRERRRPSLILLDLNMPRKDGREALRELKTDAALRSIPVVVLTNSNSPADINACYRLGANTYIRKPCGFSEFLDVLRTVKRYWFESAQLPAA